MEQWLGSPAGAEATVEEFDSRLAKLNRACSVAVVDIVSLIGQG